MLTVCAALVAMTTYVAYSRLDYEQRQALTANVLNVLRNLLGISIPILGERYLNLTKV
jgi:hypothetical protein